jgi:hypothetical protein
MINEPLGIYEFWLIQLRLTASNMEKVGMKKEDIKAGLMRAYRQIQREMRYEISSTYGKRLKSNSEYGKAK